MALTLPFVPAKHKDFLHYVDSQPDTPIGDLIRPYNDYDAVIRKIFARDPSHALMKDNHVNLVPLYDAAGSADIRVRARDLTSETPEQKEKYILPLDDSLRRVNGSPAVVSTLAEFQGNFTLFTEGSLGELNWSNVVATGSAVVTSLLPTPEKYRKSKRGLRQYYHDEFTPASDVDLFIYGLTEEQAIEKIMHIEDVVRNTIFYETTTVRTKNTITIVSQYPTRHVQIVLRIYRSVAEILTGFDVDCACVAYNGQQVYAAPRAVAAYITQTNQIDLTRRSPSYENRLSKYSRRGFEVFWPLLDRSKIRSGLARLLVLERLPKNGARDIYVYKDYDEPGYSPENTYLQHRQHIKFKGNIKDEWEDEVPEWQEEDLASNYHTFTIPYGRRYNARRIENMLYDKDMLLNRHRNRSKGRKIYLHRHPAFFGEAQHVIGDCCGFCPQPVTEEERKIGEEESRIYVSGKISFIKDDPGRQEIGSFNPVTETDWTKSAYAGGIEQLCQAIVSHDLETMRRFLSRESFDPDCPDMFGRTPLQLACMSSPPEIVQCLVDSGSRLTARMADGKTALHLAAARGNVEIIRILLTKSDENQEAGDNNVDSVSLTPASYVKVEVDEDEDEDDEHVQVKDSMEENYDDPDVYNINVVARDSHATPLHLAILHGHVEAVKELVSFGADVLIGIKAVTHWTLTKASTVNLVLALSLPLEKAKEMTRLLLQLGASPDQTDLAGRTPLHYIAQSDYSELLDLHLEHDKLAVQKAINRLIAGRTGTTFYSALVRAIRSEKHASATKLLEMGANPTFDTEELSKAIKAQMPTHYCLDLETPASKAKKENQPIVCAIQNDMPLVALDPLKRGADPNTEIHGPPEFGRTILEGVRAYLTRLRNFLKLQEPYIRRREQWELEPIVSDVDDESYLWQFKEGTYKRFSARNQLKRERERNKVAEEREKSVMKGREPAGMIKKADAIAALIRDYETLEAELLVNGAKTLEEPDPNASATDSTSCPAPNPVNPFYYAPNPMNEGPKTKKPFNIKFEFMQTEITDITRDGYLQIFEAAWNGDISTIKASTLGMWGPSQDQPPLEIAVCDQLGFSCLSLAILRGHLRVAKKIIQILRVQYKEKKLGSDGDNIVSHGVVNQFNHRNIGGMTTQSENSLLPINALQRPCEVSLFLDGYSSTKHKWKFCTSDQTSPSYYPTHNVDTLVKYAVFKNDSFLLHFLLTASQDCASMFPDKDDSDHLRESLSQAFQLAMALGHTDCVAKLIQFKAVGLPLAKLREDSGVELPEPGYYEGLSIRGKRRSSWVRAARCSRSKRPPGGRPPLLICAMQGNLNTTEWFLGTAPARHYLEYVKSHLEDDNIKVLVQSQCGLEGSILDWLQTRNNLVLHCAVMSKPCEESERLVQYLVRHHSECLEVRSKKGHTPLAIAFSLRRTSYARILIAAGANQAVRDPEGDNLLHILFNPVENHALNKSVDPALLTNALDKELVSSMLVQRAGDGAWTPLAHQLYVYRPHNWGYPLSEEAEEESVKAAEEKVTPAVSFLLDLAESTNQKHLEILNGSGNTPVHAAIKESYTHLLKLMLDRRPGILYRENAKGSTPLEMATDSWVKNATGSSPKPISYGADSWGRILKGVIDREPKFFIQGRESRKPVEVMYQICQERAQQHPGKRVLVSLFEANEVVRRAASKERDDMERYRWARRHIGEPDEYEEVDEVALWGNLA